MRARNLKPGFFKNECLLSLSPLHRLLFAGLWCMADRNGILEDRPAKIKIEILPVDDCDIDEMLDELSTADGFIERYEVAGKGYLLISNFIKHQKPHPRESALYPTPEDKQETATASREKTMASKAFPSSSLNPSLLNPSSLNPSSLNPSPPEKPSGKGSAKKLPKGCVYSPDFLDFWEACPRQQEKGSAWRAWMARLKEGARPDQLILAARHYALFVAGKDQAVMKLPATLLGPGHGPGGADPIWQEWQEPRPGGNGYSHGHGEIPTYSKKTAGWEKLYQQEMEKQRQEGVYDGGLR